MEFAGYLLAITPRAREFSMKRVAKITQGYVNNLAPEAKTYKIWDTALVGFHVKVQPSGGVSYCYFGRLPDGTDCWPTLGKHGPITATQARAIAKDNAAMIARGENPTAAKREARERRKREADATLGAFLKSRYKEWVQTRHKRSKETLRVLDKEFYHLHSKQMAGITQWDVHKYEQEKIKAGLSRSTVDRQVRDLKTCLSKAAEWGFIERNPLAGMKQAKLDKQGRVRYLEQTEVDRLRKALDDRQEKQFKERARYNEWRKARGLDSLPALDDLFTDYLKPLVLLALNTGMRRGELFNLEWSDVNLKGKILTVQGGEAKSGQTRYIPLNEEASSVLTAWADQSEVCELVFPSPRSGGRLDNINKSWANLLVRAKIQDFRLHDCRHHFASKLVMAGCDLNTVRELLGHAGLTMTLRYSHLAPEHKAAAVALLDR
jgi:integrase